MAIHSHVSLFPPAELADFGGGNFDAVGNEFFQYFISHGDLKPTEYILDVGSGNGRMAVPLTRYLTSGSYEGFDVAEQPVRWCTDTITPRFPQFHFQHVDIRNSTYNPKGLIEPVDFFFPYAAHSFDFVFLTSVFTHMLESETRHYLAEIHRVLKPGGRMFATFFLENAISNAGRTAGKSALNFSHAIGSCYTTNRNRPEDAVLFPEDLVRTACAAQGLMCRDPVLYGSWSGRAGGMSFQDIVIADKL